MMSFQGRITGKGTTGLALFSFRGGSSGFSGGGNTGGVVMRLIWSLTCFCGVFPPRPARLAPPIDVAFIGLDQLRDLKGGIDFTIANRGNGCAQWHPNIHAIVGIKEMRG